MVAAAKTILTKKEITYGVDATPTAAANAVVTRNFKSSPLEVDQLARNLDVPTRGRQQTAPTNPRASRSFELEMAGAGAAGTAAPWMEYLEACGMAPAVLTAGTDAQQKFAPVGSEGSSLTFYDWSDNQRRKAFGARGSYGFNFTAGAYPFLTLTMTALVPPGSPVDTATPGTPDFTRWKSPLEVNRDNTDLLVGGYAVVCKSLTAEAGVGVTVRNLVNAHYVRIGDHAVTGRMSIEAPAALTKDYFVNLRAGDHSSFTLTHGHTAGNIVGAQSSNLQILTIDLSEEDDTLMLDIGFALNVVAGQDDLILIAR